MPVGSNSRGWIIFGLVVYILTMNIFLSNFLKDSDIRVINSPLNDVNKPVVDNFNDSNQQSDLQSAKTRLSIFSIFWKIVFFQVTGLSPLVIFFSFHIFLFWLAYELIMSAKGN